MEGVKELSLTSEHQGPYINLEMQSCLCFHIEHNCCVMTRCSNSMTLCLYENYPLVTFFMKRRWVFTFMLLWLKPLSVMSKWIYRLCFFLTILFHLKVRIHLYPHMRPCPSSHLSLSWIPIVIYSIHFGLYNSLCSTFWTGVSCEL